MYTGRMFSCRVNSGMPLAQCGVMCVNNYASSKLMSPIPLPHRRFSRLYFAGLVESSVFCASFRLCSEHSLLDIKSGLELLVLELSSFPCSSSSVM